ncbi:MAG: ATP-binding protein [Spirochaetales bacterium]|nr:ATP-binding protein [Spirochaetales bacterium]
MIEPNKPVEVSDKFYGQRTVVRRVFSRIGADRPQSVAVIGGRKIGKTSLLNYIHDQKVQQQYLDSMNDFIFIKINLRNAKYQNAENFLSSVYTQLTQTHGQDTNWYNQMQKFVQDSHNTGKKVILLLDDFHYITRNQNFPLEFFSFLRSLANNYNLAYVTTSYLELQKLCVAKDIEESPFFNIFTNLALGLLLFEDGVSLYMDLTGCDSVQAEKLVTWCGPLPYVLKIAALKTDMLESFSDQDLEKILLPELSAYFEEIVSILPREAFKPLKELAKDRNPSPKDIHHLEPLMRQSFLIDDLDELRFYSPAFKSFILKNFSASLLKGKDSCF